MCDQIIKLRQRPELKQRAVAWFHEKWAIPLEDYSDSIKACIENKAAIPQWYVVMADDRIIGGIGVIENDFHDRKDLTPNVCALYVEENYRCQGIAGRLLHAVCEDMREKGIDVLYLLTDHTSFYERYGWEFYDMVSAEKETALSRMYRYQNK